jgi:hypothetical protein
MLKYNVMNFWTSHPITLTPVRLTPENVAYWCLTEHRRTDPNIERVTAFSRGLTDLPPEYKETFREKKVEQFTPPWTASSENSRPQASLPSPSAKPSCFQNIP